MIGLPLSLRSFPRPAGFLVIVFMVGLVAASVTKARADALAKPSSAIAREHLATGNRYYRVRNFDKAIVEYKAGAVREDTPVFHYNLGQCYRQLGKYGDAIWHYEHFLDRGKPTGEVEESVNQFIVQMKGELEKAAMKQPAPSSATKPARANPMPSVPPAAPPLHGITLQRKLAIGVGVAGLAAIGAGTVLGARAESFERDADEICPMSACERASEATALIDRGKKNALYANVAFGLGGAAVIGAAVLWITGGPRERNATAILPHVSGRFTGLAATLAF